MTEKKVPIFNLRRLQEEQRSLPKFPEAAESQKQLTEDVRAWADKHGFAADSDMALVLNNLAWSVKKGLSENGSRFTLLRRIHAKHAIVSSMRHYIDQGNKSWQEQAVYLVDKKQEAVVQARAEAEFKQRVQPEMEHLAKIRDLVREGVRGNDPQVLLKVLDVTAQFAPPFDKPAFKEQAIAWLMSSNENQQPFYDVWQASLVSDEGAAQSQDKIRQDIDQAQKVLNNPDAIRELAKIIAAKP